MPHLDLFAQRKHSTVTLGDQKVYKLPNEYTVEEVERILELREEIEAMEAQKAIGDGSAQRKAHTALVFAQLGVMFRHYQPDLTDDYLSKVITQSEALEVIGFFRRYRHLALKELRDEAEPTGAASKKKSKLNAAKELRDLRRMITFMVTCGFSLYDLKKLYIDELHEYYFELVFNLEESGKLKKGAYDKVKRRQNTPSGSSDVSVLRKQLFQSMANRAKTKL